MKQKIEGVQLLIRTILTILLLWQVFTHAHWSVGVSLALIFIAIECIGQIYTKYIETYD